MAHELGDHLVTLPGSGDLPWAPLSREGLSTEGTWKMKEHFSERFFRHVVSDWMSMSLELPNYLL